MSVREAESLVKKLSAEFALAPQKLKKEKSRDVRRVEEELADLLTADVEVRIKKRVKRGGRMLELGEVAIQFGSLEELNGLISDLPGKIAVLETQLADPGLYGRDPAAFDRFGQALAAAREKLEAAEMEWLELEERREALEAGR